MPALSNLRVAVIATTGFEEQDDDLPAFNREMLSLFARVPARV